ncbi:sugar MFS transporter [Sphingobacterium paucimobilis]|uniref:Major facilitator superfamily (MFS) profile domain-containing protein n=1 Tax=Sphingobacterium paucimobilis HER1398 TaxID=1346330 RepID=U2JEN9_9SPHI|nr:sugar MFS transporter [Sphingobacterium paucimobilis]ERJ61123.1 hypothetical protein M472_20440 [Sphingobacterium paucimobilis HER1398]
MTKSVQANGQDAGTSYKVALLVLAILYFMLGFITVLNDTLVPFFKEGFNLSYSQSSLVQFYFYLTYGLISIPAGRMVDRIGYKNGMVAGFSIAAVGAFLFYPASIFHEYFLFLISLFIVAIGIVLLQVSANPYITVLGPASSAASRLTLIQGVGSMGTTLAPVFGAHFILAKISESSGSEALVKPYLFIGTGLLLIGLLVFWIKLPVVESREHSADEEKEKVNLLGLLKKFPNLRFGIIALFMYVGAEVSIGTYLTNYIADRLEISESAANFYLTYYWGGMLVGRFLGAFFLQRFASHRILFIMALLSTSLVLLSTWSTGVFSIWAMVAVGLCNAIMFATIFSLSVRGLGAHTGTASGMLSTAIVGGAILTYVQGVLRDLYSWEIAFLPCVLAYIVIMWFGLTVGKKNAEEVVSI